MNTNRDLEARGAKVDRLDTAIDYVTARMVDVAEDAALQQRIVAALPERPAGAAWLIHTWGPRLAMVLALAVAVALWNVRDRSTPDSPLPAVAIGDASVLREGVVALAPGTAVRTERLEPLVPLEPLEPASNVDHERSLPPIEAMAALTVASLAPSELPVSEPIALESIDLEDLPLTAESFSRR